MTIGAVDRAARVVAGAGLDTAIVGITQPLDDRDWSVFAGLLERNRLIGLAALAVETERLAVTDDQFDDLTERDQRWQSHALVAERLLQEVLATLHAGDIDTRVLKGSALAHTVYAAPEHRVFGDLDVLVPGARLSDARAALTAGLGVDDVLPELRPGFDQEFAKDVLLRADGIEIDLHRTIAAGPFGLRLPVDELFDGGRQFELGDRRAPTLGPVATFVQVACNAALGDVPPRLGSLRDVAQCGLSSDIDVAAVGELARRWRLEAPVGRAVTATWDALGLADHPLRAWAGTLEIGPGDRHLLAASVTTNRSYARHVASLAAVPGLAAKARYARAILGPQQTYRRARGWQRGDHLRRAWRGLVRR